MPRLSHSGPVRPGRSADTGEAREPKDGVSLSGRAGFRFSSVKDALMGMLRVAAPAAVGLAFLGPVGIAAGAASLLSDGIIEGFVSGPNKLKAGLLLAGAGAALAGVGIVAGLPGLAVCATAGAVWGYLRPHQLQQPMG